jgi:hypothetical protein
MSLLLAATPLAAQIGDQLEQDSGSPNSRVGTRGANFLELGVGARAMAMGGAYVAIAEGVESMYWNTAGLARTVGLSVGYSYSPLYPELDMGMHFVGLAVPLLGGVVGFSANVFTSGDMLRTTTDYPDGGDPLFGESFTFNAQAVGLHYAFNLTDRLQLGFAGRFIQEGIADAKANYVGLDIGALFRTGLLGTTIGASLANLGTESDYAGRAVTRRTTETIAGGTRVSDANLVTREASVPTIFRFSILWELTGSPEALFGGVSQHRAVLLTDVSDAIDTAPQGLLGLEYSYSEILFLRGGKKWVNENRGPWEFSDGLSGGVGFRVPFLDQHFMLDYAYVSMGDLDNVQVFTFAYGF